MAEIVLDEDFDFGFFAVSEDELAQREKQAEAKALAQAEELIKQQAAEADATVNEALGTAQEYKDKLYALHKMVMPLLNNLAKDDNKAYIYWPDRTKKMTAFIAKVNSIVN